MPWQWKTCNAAGGTLPMSSPPAPDNVVTALRHVDNVRTTAGPAWDPMLEPELPYNVFTQFGFNGSGTLLKFGLRITGYRTFGAISVGTTKNGGTTLEEWLATGLQLDLTESTKEWIFPGPFERTYSQADLESPNFGVIVVVQGTGAFVTYNKLEFGIETTTSSSSSKLVSAYVRRYSEGVRDIWER